MHALNLIIVKSINIIHLVISYQKLTYMLELKHIVQPIKYDYKEINIYHEISKI